MMNPNKLNKSKNLKKGKMVIYQTFKEVLYGENEREETYRKSKKNLVCI